MNPTPIATWEKVFHDYKQRLGLPCVLLFGEHVKTAVHHSDEQGCCTVTINPTLEFERPEHLILHEFAHHRTIAPLLAKYMYADGGLDVVRIEEAGRACCIFGGAHCEHWAKDLVDMYHETQTELPYCTMFIKFADAANIKYKQFEFLNGKKWSK